MAFCYFRDPHGLVIAIVWPLWLWRIVCYYRSILPETGGSRIARYV
jgi:hypothetical protein